MQPLNASKLPPSFPVLGLGVWTALFLYLLYLSVLFWHPLTHPGDVIGTEDMVNYTYASKHLWAEGLKSGQPVLWNPYSSLGGPFLANPNSSAYSPFNLFFYLLPVSYALTWGHLLHLLLAALGTYLFLKELGAGWFGAFLGGLAFSCSSFFLAHLRVGHVTNIWAMVWLPWILLFLRLSLEKKQWRFLAAASAASALSLFEGHPQMSMYCLLIADFYLGWYWLTGNISFKKLFLTFFFFMAGSILLAACQIIPSAELAGLSNRWRWGYADIMGDFLYPENLHFFVNPFYLGSPMDGTYDLAVPGRSGYHEIATYIGLVPLFLACLGFFLSWREPLLLFFWLMAILFMLLAWADSTPLSHQVFRFFYDNLPGFGRNRSVGRITALALFCLSCAAGLTLGQWASFWKEKSPSSPAWRFLVLGGVPLLLVVASLADLWNYDRQFVPLHLESSYLKETNALPGAISALVKTDPGYPRTQSVFEKSFEQIGHIEQPLTYTLATLPLDDVNRYLKALRAHPDSPLADLIDLKYWENQDLFNHPTSRWKPLRDNIAVNSMAIPHAFLVGGYALTDDTDRAIGSIQAGVFDPREEILLEKEPAEKENWAKGWLGAAAIDRYEPDQADFTFNLSQPGFFVLSDPDYPGWKAWVDGKQTPILRADGLFRAVAVDSTGPHRIHMAFEPSSVLIPFIFSAALWTALVLGFLFRNRLSALLQPVRRWVDQD